MKELREEIIRDLVDHLKIYGLTYIKILISSAVAGSIAVMSDIAAMTSGQLSSMTLMDWFKLLLIFTIAVGNNITASISKSFGTAQRMAVEHKKTKNKRIKNYGNNGKVEGDSKVRRSNSGRNTRRANSSGSNQEAAGGE